MTAIGSMLLDVAAVIAGVLLVLAFIRGIGIRRAEENRLHQIIEEFETSCSDQQTVRDKEQ